MILGLHFQEITSLIPLVWKLAEMVPGKYTLKKSDEICLVELQLVKFGPLVKFDRLAELVPQKSGIYTIGPWVNLLLLKLNLYYQINPKTKEPNPLPAQYQDPVKKSN